MKYPFLYMPTSIYQLSLERKVDMKAFLEYVLAIHCSKDCRTII